MVSRKQSKENIEVTYGGRENCQFCVRDKVQVPNIVLESNEFSTPKRNVQVFRKALSTIITGSNVFVTPSKSIEVQSNNSPLTPDTPSTRCVITDEMLEKVETKCKNHTFDQMGEILGVQVKSLNKRWKRSNVRFKNMENDVEKCYFCKYTDICQSTDPQITIDMLEKVATKCSNHTYEWQRFLQCRGKRTKRYHVSKEK